MGDSRRPYLFPGTIPEVPLKTPLENTPRDHPWIPENRPSKNTPEGIP